MKLKSYIQFGVAALVAATAGVSCSDTWDDHYSASGTQLLGSGSLWSAIESDASLANFKKVLEETGYNTVLSSSQNFSVWAPEIDEATAQSWIDLYKAEKNDRKVKDNYNAALNQFVKNHIALYNHQVSSLTGQDTIIMMNGKRMVLESNAINGNSHFVGNRVNTGNGVLYKVDRELAFLPNIWEQVQADTVGDDKLDSVRAFFMRYNRVELDENASVQGEIIDGKIHYLDSVFTENNIYLNSYGRINMEDSAYWYLAPTNKLWNEKIDYFKNFFNFHENYGADRDSIRTLFASHALAGMTFFNVRNQYETFNAENPDSLLNTQYSKYTYKYNKFVRPFEAGGLLSGLDYINCSNGRLYRTSELRVPYESSAIFKPVELEAEYNDYYSTRRLADGDSTRMQATTVKASIEELKDGETVLRSVKPSNGYYLKVVDTYSRETLNQSEVTFEIPNILSNCPYDIFVVLATPLAMDTTETGKANAELKRIVNAKIRYYPSQTGSLTAGPSAFDLGKDIRTNIHGEELVCNRIDTIQVNTNDANSSDRAFKTKGFRSPVSGYGESDGRVFLTIMSHRGKKTGYTRDLLIDKIIFKPRYEALEK